MDYFVASVLKSMCTYNKRRHSIPTLNSKINCHEMSILFHKSLQSSFDVSNESKERRYIIICLSALKDVNIYGVQHCA